MVAKIFDETITGEGEADFYAFSKDGLDWSLPRKQTKLARPG